ncbi:hypothetical protein LAZ67_12001140 [Cordylochernes scorpioides]|uniref:Mos1 transposase HTH domain-containing protein n=1 Tax=Cordylochernes scorpioides TaxID=51811 RepID=A0ABY6L3H1_9ARAC|nr:hypothetical protein LAZ67_12001140 [Cordylochernes scorpioides]
MIGTTSDFFGRGRWTLVGQPPVVCMERVPQYAGFFLFTKKKGGAASETFDLLRKSFGEDAFERRTAFERFKRSKDGRTPVEDNTCGRPNMKEKRKEISENLLKLAYKTKCDNIRWITGDETRVYGYDPETNPQSCQWLADDALTPKKNRMESQK